MIDETTVGPTASMASHCRPKSGVFISPASAGTGGPQEERKLLTRASASWSRGGVGEGIHRLSWKEPLLAPRNSLDQASMASGSLRSAPMPPMPPALATAMARLAG